MIGHEKTLADLKDLNENGRLGHGYVFYGPAMVGKKLFARTFAEYLEKDASDDGMRVADEKNSGAAESAAVVGMNIAPEILLSDYMLITPGENGSIGIDAVRDIKNFLWQKPNASSRRTLIIDEAELLTAEAQNALLKVTEEPPASSLLILVTSDAESILPTIISRLPKIYFGTVGEKEIAEWLAQMGEEALPVKAKKTTVKKLAFDPAGLAKRSFGKPGLALRLLGDKGFQEQIEQAEKLLKTPAATRRDVIKKIIEPDEFSFRKFLDAIILVIAWQRMAQGMTQSVAPKNSQKNDELWHKALALYDHETNFSLNPRLQLEALLGA